MTSKSSITLRLTEPVVFLRPTQGPNATSSQPAMVRGLLTLNLRRASRVKSIEVRLETRTSVIWPEGIGVRRMEIVEEHIIRSQRILFFDASSTSSSEETSILPARRAISVGPGLHLDDQGDDASDPDHIGGERRRLPGGAGGDGGDGRGGREREREEMYAPLQQRAMSTARGMSVGRGYASMVGAEHEPAQEHPYPAYPYSRPPAYARTDSMEREEAGLSPIQSSGESRSASRSRTRGRTADRTTGRSGSGSRSESRGRAGEASAFARAAVGSLSPVRGILNRHGSSPAPSTGTGASGSTIMLGTSPAPSSAFSATTTTPASSLPSFIPPSGSGSTTALPPTESAAPQAVQRPALSPRSSNTSLPSQHSAPSIRNLPAPGTSTSPTAHVVLEPGSASASASASPSDASPLHTDSDSEEEEEGEEYEPESMHPLTTSHQQHGGRHGSTSTVTPAHSPSPGPPAVGAPKHRVTFARRVSQGALQNLMRRNSRDEGARAGPSGGVLVDSPPGSGGSHGHGHHHHHLHNHHNQHQSPQPGNQQSLSQHTSPSPVPSPHHSVHFPSPPGSAHNLALSSALSDGSPAPSLRNFPSSDRERDEPPRSRSRSRVRGVVEGMKNMFRSSSRQREHPTPNGQAAHGSGEHMGFPSISRQSSRDSPGPGTSSRPPTSRRGSMDTHFQRPFMRRGSTGEQQGQTGEGFVEPGPRGSSPARERERRGSDAAHPSSSGGMHYYGRGGAGAARPHDEGSEERRGRERERGRERSRDKSGGDAWREFRKGTYTYPIVFPLPPAAPTTVHTEFGSVRYYLVGVVHRSGPFSPRLQSEKEVEVIDTPPDEEPETVLIERQWEESLRYVIGLDNKTNLVGGELAFDLTLMPLDKTRIYRLSVGLEQKIDYFSRGQRLTRYDPPKKWDLLNVKSLNKNTPLLPLSSLTPSAGPVQQLLALCPPGMDVSEYAGSLLELSGPWQIHEVLKLPTCKMGIHRSVKLSRGGAAVKITHTLKIVIRVERTDSTGSKKWDIMVDTPINLFDCRCSPEYTSLPTYNALMQPVPASSASCACPHRGTGSNTPLSVPDSVLRLVQSHAPGPIASITHASGTDSPPPGVAGPSLVESLAERNRQFARLVEGREDIEGETPPSYEEVVGAAGPSTGFAPA